MTSFFFAFLGEARYSENVRELIRTHAGRLGFAERSCELILPGGLLLLYARLGPGGGGDATPAAGGHDPFFLLTTPLSFNARDSGRPPSVWENQIEFLVDPAAGTATVSLPPASPEPFYYARDRRGWVFGNDQRPLLRWAGGDLDERAIHAVLQYGAVPAPFTFSPKVCRIPSGHRLHIAFSGTESRIERVFEPGRCEGNRAGSASDAASILSELDQVLQRVPPSPVLYFSGGVDSGLLAARLARLDRRDTYLLNYSFSEADPEADLAGRMAAHLGMKIVRVPFDLSDLANALERLPLTYSFPFCDLSTLPTYLLVQASLPHIGEGRSVLEGTGADGAFGIGIRYPFWRRLYSFPRWARVLVSAAYRAGSLWRSDSRSKLELWGRIARRSVQMPLSHAAVLAVNSLEGIAYEISPSHRTELEEAVRTYVEAPAASSDPMTQLSFLDLVHVCAGMYAAKSFDPLRAAGVYPLYPYLCPRLISRALSLSWSEKCPAGEPKGILKKALASEVPPEMVYRAKSGFLPPFEILAHPDMQEFLRAELLSPGSPLSGFFREAIVREILDRAVRRETLSQGAHNLVWALGFSSAWYRKNVKG